ncbi:MAG: L-seryl-tRNA(Sec) selenium transferase [Candidatus Eremiobacteraeota bacterium]|nr:L-seryl-tRNA(Sec) selenium transferase [Candidatus Eremiobacteraeota bacterium]MBC5801938.1 L-seryl-tRNA(Sec) selenium transferase [Candidatus Eremiobacteraeota bacterium]MBC5821664.1 L-seryl-tRNA(Sec) selenium transferase [Candidatus Eremiobacteraeota bacterium]
MSRFLAEPEISAWGERVGTTVVKAAVDSVLRDVRATVTRERQNVPPFDALLERVDARLAREEHEGLVAVLNGTGILLHTNLGRAPLAAAALDAVVTLDSGYSNLEFDLGAGARGSRYARVTSLLCATTGARDALVVNNCAAAILLILDTFAKGREVIVSRGELVEIGGGFRLPDVLARSGASLVEVGTTNKTYLRDFERALTQDTALLLRSHTSNYRIEGFTAEAPAAELARLGHRAGIATAEDLGSGALIDVTQFGLPHERTVLEAVADGIDLVAFSGDKLLGGPQAGIIVGAASAVARLRANPLLRALRVDKATLAALAATLRLYVRPGGWREIPFYRMLATPLDELRDRAQRLVQRVECAALNVRAVALQSYAGGGTLPQAGLASYGLSVRGPDHAAEHDAARLRAGRPRLVTRIADGAVLIDLRTIPPESDNDVADVLTALRR